MTIQEAKTKFIVFVRSQLGTHEGANNYNKYADDPKIAKLYGWIPQNQPWCCTFANWCYLNCFGYDVGSRLTYGGTAACKNSASLFRAANAFVKTPEIGDQAFYYVRGDINHTGIVVSIDGNSFQAVEGNYSDKVSLVTHKISGEDVAGFGRPHWKLVEDLDDSTITDAGVPADDAAVTSVEKRILRKGMSGTDVLKLQEDLITLGYNLGSWGADGDFGRDTKNAVIKFQEDYHVDPVDGEVGPLTYAALEAAINSKQTKVDDAGQKTNPALINPSTPKYPSVVIGGSIIDEIPDDGYPYHIGDTVQFIGSLMFFTANGNVSVKMNSQNVLIVDVNHSAKHPYKIRPLKRFSLIGTGWVNEDALKDF